MTKKSRKGISRSSLEALIFTTVFLGIFIPLGIRMGGDNLLNTIMRTAHGLLLNTVFYLMSITVLTGALAKLMSEFGLVSIIGRVLKPLMKPLFNLPGVAGLGAIMTFLSDNPAIIALARDKSFASYFKKYQLLSLTNFGTAFGMGFVVIVTMMSFGQPGGALIGLFGAFCGSIISTRIMQRSCLKSFPELDSPAVETPRKGEFDADKQLEGDTRQSVFLRFINAILDGGKSGVELGLTIIPGVLVITTMVILITFGAGPEGYTGAANQGVPVLPWLAEKIHWVFEWLFGFTDMRLIAFPMTTLGAVGAALGLLPTFNAEGILDGNAIAVFTAIGMCWSGFLSTHTAMLDALGFRKAISKALGAHTVAGLAAGIIAHFLYLLVSLL
ncbi:MAG: nucleoside recognition domain-containing protein [Bacteroidaceae bacterium]|nr:nucleoside recognition domain-containing protein [Bacteroidaceae bacterium]